MDDARGKARFRLPARWSPAAALVERATRVYRSLRSVELREVLASGSGKPVVSTWRLVAPSSLSYEIEGGGAGIVIGSRRWDRGRDGRWRASAQDPLTVPTPPWTDAVENASLLGSGTLAGRPVRVVSFLDRAALPTWFTLWIDAETSRTLALRMTTAAHFMRQRYGRFDEPLRVTPPKGVASSEP